MVALVAACGDARSSGATAASPAAPATPAASVRELPAIEWRRHGLADAGCFVVRDLATGAEQVSDRERCARPRRPHSTFKIANALIGLDLGILDGADSVMTYDAAAYPAESWWPDGWNRDQTLRDAIRISAVPLFRRLANQIGAERMRLYIDRLDYGNRDLGGAGLDWFWLGGRLRISAVQQVELLTHLVRDELPVSRHAQAVAREVLFKEQRGSARVCGKTGTGTLEDPPPAGLSADARLGWLVGWVEQPDRTIVYAMWVEAQTPDEVRARRQATVDAVLTDLGVPPPAATPAP